MTTVVAADAFGAHLRFQARDVQGVRRALAVGRVSVVVMGFTTQAGRSTELTSVTWTRRAHHRESARKSTDRNERPQVTGF
ncbi:hypothetical protein ACWGH4_03790 [Streptomyces sp. NPDC054847]